MSKHQSPASQDRHEAERLRELLDGMRAKAKLTAEFVDELAAFTAELIKESKRKDKSQRQEHLQEFLNQWKTLRPKPESVTTTCTRCNWKKPPLKVAIAGLIGNQFKEMTEEITGPVKFINLEKSARKLPSKVDHVLFLANKSSHSLENQLKGKYNTRGQKIVETIKGTGKLRERIKELAENY